MLDFDDEEDEKFNFLDEIRVYRLRLEYVDALDGDALEIRNGFDEVSRKLDNSGMDYEYEDNPDAFKENMLRIAGWFEEEGL